MAGDLDGLVERLAEVIRANYLRVDDPDQPLAPDEARRVAAQVLERVLDPAAFPRMCIERALLFVVEEAAAPGGGDVLHVMAWDGDRWVAVDALPLPHAQGTPDPGRP